MERPLQPYHSFRNTNPLMTETSISPMHGTFYPAALYQYNSTRRTTFTTTYPTLADFKSGPESLQPSFMTISIQFQDEQLILPLSFSVTVPHYIRPPYKLSLPLGPCTSNSVHPNRASPCRPGSKLPPPPGHVDKEERTNHTRRTPTIGAGLKHPICDGDW